MKITTTHSFIHSFILLLMDIWAVSGTGLLWILLNSFPKWFYQLALLRAVCENSTCSASLSTPGLVSWCSFNDFGHCAVVSCGFVLISLMTKDVEHIFICFLATWLFFFAKCLFKFFAHLKIGLPVFFLLIYGRSLYFCICDLRLANTFI